ncbi:MAG: alginate lyase family protein [Prevotella sp.]
MKTASTIRKIRVGLLLMACSLSVCPMSAQRTFVHPGITDTKESLDRMKLKVNANIAPWITGYNYMVNNESGAKSTYKASANSNSIRQRMSSDGMAAYYNLLQWWAKGTVANADCAVNIINTWTNSILSNTNGVIKKDSNGEVKTSELFMLGISDIMRAAEILRQYSGWAKEDRSNFEKVAREYFLPGCRNFLKGHSWPGWGGPANQCIQAIGIFLDDEEIYNEALDNFKNGKSGECITKGILAANGQPVEMGRDQPHVIIGIASYAKFCESAWNQGDDLYGYEDNLLFRGYEYYYGYNLGHTVDWTPVKYNDEHMFWFPAHNSNNPGSLPQNRICGEDILCIDMVYHHYKDRKGMDMPYSGAMINLHSDATLRGTLYTHSDEGAAIYTPKAKPDAPKEIVAIPGVRQIRLEWDIPEGEQASGFILQRSVRGATSGFATLATYTDNITNYYIDSTVTVGTTYYYRVRAKNQSGNSSYTEAVAASAVEGSTDLPAGWYQKDLGTDDAQLSNGSARNGKGVTLYNEINGNTFIIKGYGTDIYTSSQPEGNYTYTTADGDFDFICRLYELEQSGSEIKVKLGLQARESLDLTDKLVNFYIGEAGTRQSFMRWRTSKGGNMQSFAGCDHLWKPIWYRMIRRGNEVECLISDYGEKWYSLGKATISLSEKCLVGMYVCSGAYLDNGFTAQFDNVSIGKPTPSAIKGIADDAGNMTGKCVYDMQGRRCVADSLQPGLYISNCRKMVVR